MNTWVLAKDLDRIAAASAEKDADLGRLCRRLKAEYSYPVDTVLLSPGLDVLGQKDVNIALREGPGGYRRLLRHALGEGIETAAEDGAAPQARAPDPGVGAGAGRRGRRLTLSPSKPSGTMLDVLAAGKFIAPMDRLFAIDLTAFPGAGRLVIEIRVGSSAAAGVFDLLEMVTSDDGSALVSLSSPVPIAAGKTGRITHSFQGGRRLLFSARAAAGGAADATNAFSATVTVQPAARVRGK